MPRTDTSGNARRKQKAYSDILGRTWKTETFEWDGTTVYSTAVSTFNGRDQVTQARQYAGSTSSSTYQDTTATFDGHGRMATSHKPEQRDSSNNLKYTAYNYNPDDSVLSMTDGRGAVTNLEYNSRGLLTEKSWTVPGGSGITDPTDVTFSYDNLGNRTQMIDGLGTVDYAYNELSQMTSETRDFTDNLPDAPLVNSNQAFRLSYTYTLAGQLKSYTDPYGKEIAYTHDETGRLSTVTGTSFGGVTSYASNPVYRAWGALKELDYGNATEATLTYNNRLQSASFELKKSTTILMKKNYEYYQSGDLKFVDDEVSSAYDNLFEYDHAGRLKSAKSSVEATGGSQTNLLFLPFRQSFDHNAFGNMTEYDATRWTDHHEESFAYANNRKTFGWYDEDGRDLTTGSFDAAGRIVSKDNDSIVYRHYGGDGTETKRSVQPWNYELEDYDPIVHAYLIRSSVLGGALVTEAGTTGKKEQTYVLAAGAIIAPGRR